MNYPLVSIIILNWNGWKDTIECLESLYQINYPHYNIIVLDNGSKDESIDKLRDYSNNKIVVKSEFLENNQFRKPIKLFEYEKKEVKSFEKEFYNLSKDDKKLILIRNDKNYGFAEGNNIGIEFALKTFNSDYLLLLNNDTVVEKNFLRELVNVATSDEKIGVTGPKICYYDYKGRKDVINFAGENINFYTSIGKRFGRFEVDKGQYDEIRESDKIDGSCMLIKRNVIEIVGMFDPVYFAYWEEADLCVRIKKAGFKLIYVPSAKIWHKIGVSWDTYFSYFIIYHYLVRNRLIFIWKYASVFQKIVFTCFFVFYLLFNSALMLIKEDLNTSKEGLKAIKNGIRDFLEYKSQINK